MAKANGSVLDPTFLIAFEYQFHAFFHGQRGQFRQFFAHQLGELHRDALRVVQLRFDTGHGQQLTADARGAVDAVDQKVQGLAALLGCLGALGVLCMDAQNRQGRAQFMGGVRDEAAFTPE